MNGGYLNEFLPGMSNPVETQGQKILQEGLTIYQDDFAKKYPKLGEMFESDNIRDHQTAAATAIVMRNQARFIDQMKMQYGESTVVGALGQLAPRLMDVVRIFFPFSRQALAA